MRSLKFGISAENHVYIGKNCEFKGKKNIHLKRNVDIPVIDQGIVQKNQKVSIGNGSYIGINSVIVGNVTIGKHCVVGANSVVTKDVPDYCVVVGSPARIIKKM